MNLLPDLSVTSNETAKLLWVAPNNHGQISAKGNCNPPSIDGATLRLTDCPNAQTSPPTIKEENISMSTNNEPTPITAVHVGSKVAELLQSIPVFYSEKMVAESEGYSPSAAKPKAVVEAWQALGVSLALSEPMAVSQAQFSLAHNSDYVFDVLTCKVVNGFGNYSQAVAHSLPWTTGSMLSAARAALVNKRVAVAPCSGFHHAGHAHGAGFCTFNGLMVTAGVLLNESVVRKVGILDLDQHWGDGTQDIIEKLHLSEKIRHYHPTMQRLSGRSSSRFLEALPEIVGTFADCDLVLYQAGADPHIDDPLGGWLTTAELMMRDRIVFTELARLQIPVAWNLAGGYQRDKEGTILPVLQIHDNTMNACAGVHMIKTGTRREGKA